MVFGSLVLIFHYNRCWVCCIYSVGHYCKGSLNSNHLYHNLPICVISRDGVFAVKCLLGLAQMHVRYVRFSGGKSEEGS